jgi:hypothetical protein
MQELQRICAQALDIGNGRTDVLNRFPIFHSVQTLMRISGLSQAEALALLNAGSARTSRSSIFT